MLNRIPYLPIIVALRCHCRRGRSTSIYTPLAPSLVCSAQYMRRIVHHHIPYARHVHHVMPKPCPITMIYFRPITHVVHTHVSYYRTSNNCGRSSSDLRLATRMPWDSRMLPPSISRRLFSRRVTPVLTCRALESQNWICKNITEKVTLTNN